jgi:type II secretory pathway component PulF
MPSNNISDIIRDLATLIEASISVIDSAKKVAASYPANQGWSRVISKLESGHQLNKALFENSLINRFEQEIISVAEFSGRLPQGLRSVADAHDKRRIRVDKLKSKLYFPYAVLIIAVIVSSIQASNQSDSSLFAIITSGIFCLVLVFILTRSILGLVQKDACHWLQYSINFKQQGWYKQQFQQVIFSALLWQVRSGIDFKTAFQRMKKIFQLKSTQKQLSLASHYCGTGISVTQSIIQSKLAITNEFKQLLLVAEQSGQWETTVEGFLRQQAILLEVKLTSFLEWLPRIYYVLIAAFSISVIF